MQHLLMAVTNRLLAQSDEPGALPIAYAATQDVPATGYVGPDGIGEQRGHPKLVGRTGAARDADTARRLWDLSEQVTGVGFPLARAAA